MNTRPFSRLFLVCLVAILAATFAAPAFAAPPTTEQVTDVFSVPTFVCGFPIEGTFAATIKVSTFVDKNGDVVRTIERFLRGALTFANLETGTSITGKIAGPLITRGSTQTATGINALFVVPGQGRVAAQVGRLVFVDDELVFQAGQNDELFPTLCSVLEGTR